MERVTNGGPPTRNEAVARTRRAIVDAARRSFADKGFDATSIRDIADAAGLTHPAVTKHFATKEDVLEAVAAQFDRAHPVPEADVDSLASVMQRWERSESDYTRLSAVLLNRAVVAGDGGSTLLAHPRRTADAWALAALRAGGDESPDPTIVSVAPALWLGLQVVSCYLPEHRPTSAMRHLLRPAQPPPAPSDPPASLPLPLQSILPDDAGGYATGRRRRERILEDATALFARHGYHGTTMRSLAREVGTTSSTLLHHFASKADLLSAVLLRRDAAMVQRRGDRVMDPVDELRDLGGEARRDRQTEAGLIDLYAVLSTEAAVPSHPAHDYFRERFARTIAYFESLLARARPAVRPRVSSTTDALLLVALWDGLQYERLLDPVLDIAAVIDAYVDRVLLRDGAAVSAPSVRRGR